MSLPILADNNYTFCYLLYIENFFHLRNSRVCFHHEIKFFFQILFPRSVVLPLEHMGKTQYVYDD